MARLVGWLRRGYLWMVVGLIVVMIGVAVYALIKEYGPKKISSGNVAPFKTTSEYDDFYAKNPLYGKQAPAGSRFSMESYLSRDKQPVYKIHLLAPPMNPTSPASVQNFLDTTRAIQQEALEWIKKQGVDPDKLYIIWDPDPSQLTATEEAVPPIPQR